jgi:3-oxoacyl-[acyl-carrier protein] reductase
MTSTLTGRVALVTGVGRRAGIGFAIAQRLLAEGAAVFLQSWTPHDADQPWGADDVDALVADLGQADRLAHVELDLADPDAPAALVTAAVDRFGTVDLLVANHARSSHQALEELTVAELDAAWAVNARASILLVQAFAAQHDDARPGGRIVLFTSGQHLAPMADELPYAVSKGAIHQMTRTLAAHLAPRGITVNAVNPGPTDTGWATPELTERVAASMPSGRWGQPADAANLVAFLASDDGVWITGQVIDSEGGFRRAAMS